MIPTDTPSFSNAENPLSPERAKLVEGIIPPIQGF
jgi:hypothetical protein